MGTDCTDTQEDYVHPTVHTIFYTQLRGSGLS